MYAPATFQFEATADNAERCVWDFGDGSVIQIGDHQASHTFTTPGMYTVRVVAFNGTQQHQREATVVVRKPPAGVVHVHIRVTDQGTQVRQRRRPVVVSQVVDLTGKNSPTTIEQTVPAGNGFEIVSVEQQGQHDPNANLSKVQWQITPDKKSVKVTAQVVKSCGAPTAVLNQHLVLTEQRKASASREPLTIMGALVPPGTTTLRLPPVPDHWTEVRRQYAFELRQGDQVLWQGTSLPKNAPVVLNGRTYLLRATATGAKLQIDLMNPNSAN